ncbi:hypothetical protein [Tunicatimonas pelagia]|uniref:hypothetical protein n=1 Tax=Tunicatimonas pelagia TaxID=931531 RepID=UPI002667175E|nr:hypothetical protein [Tunicatimonas pelagia]WKN44089.1 hypothetical protein P0M28_03795 [Tunicatimonas pelagia]
MYVYHAKLDGNFRGLFGGDNDVTVYFAGDGALNLSASSPGRLSSTNSANTAPFSISRWAGRNKVWRKPNVKLDNSWDGHESEPTMAVVGHQVKDGGLKLKGKIGLGVDWDKKKWFAKIKPNVEVQWEFPTTDRALSVLGYRRDQFFLENWRNADGYGTYDGRAVRKAGSGKRKTVYHTFRIHAYGH